MIFFFTVALENLQFNCDPCNKANSSDKGLTQNIWMKEPPRNEFRVQTLPF